MALPSPKVHHIEYAELNHVISNNDPLLNAFNIFLEEHKHKFSKGDLIRSSLNYYRNQCLFIWDGNKAIVPYNSSRENNYSEDFNGQVEPDDYGYLPNIFNPLEYNVWGKHDNNWWNINHGITHNFYFYTDLSSSYGELKENLYFKYFEDNYVVAVSWFHHPIQGKITVVYQSEEPHKDDIEVLKEDILRCFKEDNFYAFENFDLNENVQEYVDAQSFGKCMYITDHVLRVVIDKHFELITSR